MLPHIKLPEGVPGIRSGFKFRPEIAQPMQDLANALMRSSSPDSLSNEEREMIATFVSKRNGCYFCQASHSAIVAHLNDGDYSRINAVCSNYQTAPISAKLKSLLTIAGKVQISGKEVTTDDINAAKQEGATDLDIHDTVLIAATFCMYNRYVDGLAMFTPTDPAIYDTRGKLTAMHGYQSS